MTIFQARTVMENDDNVMEFLLLHWALFCKSDTTSFIKSNYEP